MADGDPGTTRPQSNSGPNPQQANSNVRSLYFVGACSLALLLLTLSDIGGPMIGSAEAKEPGKEIPTPKYASMMAGPSIKFLYW
jgi:hypothetical protein